MGKRQYKSKDSHAKARGEQKSKKKWRFMGTE